MKLTLGVVSVLEGKDEEEFDPSNLSWRISNLDASKVQDHEFE
mgnify:FL=1